MYEGLARDRLSAGRVELGIVGLELLPSPGRALARPPARATHLPWRHRRHARRSSCESERGPAVRGRSVTNVGARDAIERISIRRSLQSGKHRIIPIVCRSRCGWEGADRRRSVAAVRDRPGCPGPANERYNSGRLGAAGAGRSARSRCRRTRAGHYDHRAFRRCWVLDRDRVCCRNWSARDQSAGPGQKAPAESAVIRTLPRRERLTFAACRDRSESGGGEIRTESVETPDSDGRLRPSGETIIETSRRAPNVMHTET